MSSMNDELGVQIGFKFESEKEVMPKVKSVLDKISNNTNIEVHFGVDRNELNKILDSTAKLNKTSIQLDQDGKTIQAISEINTGLNQTLKLIENAKGTKINITNDFAKTDVQKQKEELKEIQRIYGELGNLQSKQYDIKTKLITADTELKGVLQDQLESYQKQESLLRTQVNNSNLKNNEYENKLIEEKIVLQEKYQQSLAKADDISNAQQKIQAEKEYLELFKQAEQIEKQKIQDENIAYNESLKLLQQEYQIKTLLLTAEGKYKDILTEQLAVNQKIQSTVANDNVANKLLAEKVTLNEKYQQSLAKVTDQQNAQSQKNKEEQAEMQRLITLEKQRLNNKLELYKNKYKGNEDVRSLNDIANAIENLGKSSTNLKDLKKEFQSVSQEIKNMETSTKIATGNISKHDDLSFINNLKANITSLTSYFMSGSLLYAIGNTFRDATSYVVELDSAMVNLKKVTDETDYTYKNFLNTAHNMSMEFGSQSNKVVDAVTNWAKMGKTLQEATKLAENTMLFTKVGDIENVDTASKLMIAPLTAFNIEAEKSIELIDKYNNISNNMATTSQAVGEALARSASSMVTAGNTLDQTIALISTAESKTKLGGEAVGTALRSISLNLATFKDSETGEPILKLKEDLQSLGVQAVDSSGQIRSTFDILMDLSKVWNDLDRNTQLSLSEKIGGKRQANFVGAILSDTKELQRAYDLSVNSANSAMNEFEKYQESIQYSVDRLKEQMNELYTNLVGSNFLKGITELGVGAVGAINGIVKSFGLLPSAITLAGTAFLMFNKNANGSLVAIMNSTKGISLLQTKLIGLEDKFTSQIKYLRGNIEKFQQLINTQKMAGTSTSGLGVRLVGLNTKLALTEAKLIATKLASLALQSALSFGLSILITGLVTKFMEFGDSVIHAKEKLKEFNDEFASSMKNDSPATASDLLNQYKNISEELEVVSVGTEAYSEKQKELTSIMESLIAVYPDAITYIDNETNKKMLNVDATQKLIDKNIELAKSKAGDVLDKNNMNDADSDSIERMIQNYENANEKLKIYNQLKANGQKWYKDEEGDIHLVSAGVKRYTEEVEQYQSAINAGLPALKILKDENVNLAGAYEILNNYVNQSTNAINDNTNAKQNNANSKVDDMGSEINTDAFTIKTKQMEDSLISLGLTADEVKEKMEKIDVNNLGSSGLVETATEQFAKTTSEIESLYKMIEKINEEGKMTPQLMAEIASKYNDIGSAVFETSTAQEFLNNKIAGMESVQSEAIQIMRGNDANYYNELLSNGDSLQKSFDSLASQFIDTQSSSYDFDVKNFATLNDAKSGMATQLAKALAQHIANFTNGNAEEYERDLRSFTSLAQQKTYVIQKLDAQISKVQDHYNNIIHSANSIKLPGAITGKMRNDSVSKMYDMASQSLNTQLEEMKVAKANIDTSFAEFNKVFAKTSPNFSSGDYLNGGKGTSSGSSGSKSSAEKQVENIEDLTDRYYKLNEALSTVENALSRLNTEMENANDEQRVKLLDKEIALLNEKRTALQNLLKEYQNEAKDNRGTLGNAGFKFNTDGSISNYSQRMKELQKWANSQSDPDKKKEAQEYYKEISKLTEEYFNLLKKTMPDIENKIADITNETISAQKEIADILKKQKDEFIKNEEEKTEKVKTELQKQKDLLNKKWKEEDEQDKRAEKQNEIAQLEADLSTAIRTGDESLAYSIRQQLVEAQKELDDMIRDSERDIINDRFDEEMDKLDEDLENKIDMIEAKLGDEDILRMVQSGVRDLSSALNDIDKTTKGVNRSFAYVGDTVTNIGGIIGNTWISGIDAMIEKIKEMMSILPKDMTLDINSNMPSNRKTAGSSIKIDMGGINLEGITREEFDREFDKMKDEVYKTIDNNLNR